MFHLRMKRYTELPLTLYRIQTRMPVLLRRYDEQLKLIRSSFDLKTHNGVVKPQVGLKFEVPNGMTLRPASEFLVESLQDYEGEPIIYSLPKGMQLPSDFCIYREQEHFYSLQTTEEIGFDEFNKKLTDFLNSLPQMKRSEFLEKMNA